MNVVVTIYCFIQSLVTIYELTIVKVCSLRTHRKPTTALRLSLIYLLRWSKVDILTQCIRYVPAVMSVLKSSQWKQSAVLFLY